MAEKIIAQKLNQIDLDKQVQKQETKDNWETPVLTDCGGVADITKGNAGGSVLDGAGYS